jgi:hypothetical protein
MPSSIKLDYCIASDLARQIHVDGGMFGIQRHHPLTMGEFVPDQTWIVDELTYERSELLQDVRRVIVLDAINPLYCQFGALIPGELNTSFPCLFNLADLI